MRLCPSIVSETEKRCPKCGLVKPFSEFYSLSEAQKQKHRHGLSSHCKSCLRLRCQEYENTKRKPRERLRTTRYNRKWRYKKYYGITLDEYDRLYELQDGLCCICGAEESANPYGVLEVDHNHTTGQVRGLLCSSCNKAIAWYENWAKHPLKDKLLAYLERYQ